MRFSHPPSCTYALRMVWRVSDTIRKVRSDRVANTDYASETATFQIAFPTCSILEGLGLSLPRRLS